MERAYHIEIFMSSILIKKIIKLVKMEWGHPLLVREIDNLQRQLVFPKRISVPDCPYSPREGTRRRLQGQSSRIKISPQGEFILISDHFFGKK